MESRSLPAKEAGKNKIIVILGPTASGKSSIAIKLARKFNGEIISADSRQIYRYANLTTGKVEPDQPGEIPQRFVLNKSYAGSPKYSALISQSIPHYLIDILSLNSYWSASQFQKKAQKIIADILQRQKLPIVCGGTGFWIKALVDNVVFPEVKPDWKLRARLNKFSAQKLFSILKKLDARRAANIDAQNKVRLIRAIEICKKLGSVPKTMEHGTWNMEHKFLQIGISISKKDLYKNIKKRLKKRLQQRMIKEVENLHQKHNISWKRLEDLGLEFRWIARFLQYKISREEMKAKLYFDIIHYAKRQMTWFKKDSRIKWLENHSQIEKLARNFLK
ncbi:tRNA (adenosine(37)-N6)-dimethylallyltransferase MiaA [Patescibacteria group bacterium]|nr:tRNA (adenosine(37)-N6)-dimethylallyltransferase MiaA [Patescibacteria group bacterium]